MPKNVTPPSIIVSADQWQKISDIVSVQLQQVSDEKEKLATENEWLREKVERLESEKQSYADLQQSYETLATWARHAYDRLRIYAPRGHTFKSAPDCVKRNFIFNKEHQQ